MENINWLQVGAFFVPVLGLALAGLAYLTRQFNRINDRITRVEELIIRVEQRLGDRIGRLEQQQARMLGFLEGRGVMGKAPAAETVS